MFARWHAILSVFYFDIEYIKGSQNSMTFSPMNLYSAIMASRRSKDKQLATADTSKQLVKHEPTSPIEIANRFTTLGTIPKPNYSTVLASSYDPYAIVIANHPIQTAFPRNPNASSYVKNNITKNCFLSRPTRL